MRLEIGSLTFDSDRRQLLRGERPVHVTPKALKLLQVLVESRPRALSKGELQTQLWPGLHVSETNLAVLVNELRDALGDDARHPQFVRTVHGFGYAFAADPLARSPSTPVVHRLLWGPVELALAEGENVIGREREVDVCIAEPSVSRRHARIQAHREQATLENLSSHGTFLDGGRISGIVPLHDGSEIRIGSVSLRFQSVSTTASTLSKTDP